MFAKNNLWKAADFCHHQFGDGHLIYHQLSGNTHLLSTAAAQILILLQQHPTTTNNLAAAIAPLLNLQTNDEFLPHFDAILHELHQLGLIEPL